MILQQLLRNAVPLLQIGWAIVGSPDPPASIFPNQNLHWQINRRAARRYHHRSAALGVPEDQQLRGTHLQSSLLSLSAVVHQSEERHGFRLQNAFELLHRFVYRMVAGLMDDSVVRNGCR